MVHGLPDATRVVFDDERVVANAGVLLPALLADRLGIEGLVDRAVDLGDRARSHFVVQSVDVAAADSPQPGQKRHPYPERQGGCDVLPFERA